MSRYLEILAPNGAITSPLPLATQAGVDILQNGGTAADAVAAAFCVMLVREAGLLMADVAIDGFIWDPSPSVLNRVRFRGQGAVDGLASILMRFGTRSLYDLAREAESYGKSALGLAWSADTAFAGQLGELELKSLGHRGERAELLVDPCRPGDVSVSAPSADEEEVARELARILARESDQDLLSRLAKLAGPISTRERATGEVDAEASGVQSIAADHRGIIVSLAVSKREANSSPFQVVICEDGYPVIWTGELGRNPLAAIEVACMAQQNGLRIQSAAEAPRVRAARDQAHFVGEETFDIKTELSLASALHIAISDKRWDARQGCVQGIAVDRRRGLIHAAADPRLGGQAAGY